MFGQSVVCSERAVRCQSNGAIPFLSHAAKITKTFLSVYTQNYECPHGAGLLLMMTCGRNYSTRYSDEGIRSPKCGSFNTSTSRRYTTSVVSRSNSTTMVHAEPLPRCRSSSLFRDHFEVSLKSSIVHSGKPLKSLMQVSHPVALPLLPGLVGQNATLRRCWQNTAAFIGERKADRAPQEGRNRCSEHYPVYG